jgi:Tfp pilus assembly protein PilN
MAVIASAVCAAIVLACSFSSMWHIHQRHAAVVRMLEQRGRIYERLRPDVRSLLQRQERLEGVIRRLEQVAAEADLIARGVAQVADALPETVWLTRMAWVKRTGAPGGQLEGTARSYQDLTQLLERLKALPRMGQVKLLSSVVAVDPTSGREQVTFAVVFQQQEAVAE